MEEDYVKRYRMSRMFLHVYTKTGPKELNAVNNSVHLGISTGNGEIIPLNDDSGVIFPRADYESDPYKGVTKTITDPMIYRMDDGAFGIYGKRRNEFDDEEPSGRVLLFKTFDFIDIEEIGLVEITADITADSKIQITDNEAQMIRENLCGSVKEEDETRLFPYPYRDEHVSDPCILHYEGMYYLTYTQDRRVAIYPSETLEGLRTAEPVTVYEADKHDDSIYNIWAQEMHVIRGVPYIFTTIGKKEWHTVRSVVFRCNGDILDPDAWEGPHLVERKDGTELNPDGISLDMTYFEDGGKGYVMWSNREITYGEDGRFVSAGSADLYIASVNPDIPWKLESEPVCLLRPKYGWDRLETEVDEGPYILRHGDDLFITFSGSSTGQPELYCIGLLKTESGRDLLNPDVWKEFPYPLLNRKSIAGQEGPGHNSFIKDEKTGDDLLIYHSVTKESMESGRGRQMGIRRVVWDKNGLPRL